MSSFTRNIFYKYYRNPANKDTLNSWMGGLLLVFDPIEPIFWTNIRPTIHIWSYASLWIGRTSNSSGESFRGFAKGCQLVHSQYLSIQVVSPTHQVYVLENMGNRALVGFSLVFE